MSSAILTIHFEGTLPQILHRKWRKEQPVRYPLERKASIKDIIEAMGVPHTEVGRISSSDGNYGFGYLPERSENLKVLPFDSEITETLPNRLWPVPWTFGKFMVDVNALKVARNLRMAGIDTSVIPNVPLRKVGELAAKQKRVVLTRDRQLLKCASLEYGQLLRAEDHIEQFEEVVARFNLFALFHPFSRCLKCNGILQRVAKKEIIHLLEPLTKKYYTDFKRCPDCLAIYWHGSHMAPMQRLLAMVKETK